MSTKQSFSEWQEQAAERYATGNHSVSFADTSDEKAHKAGSTETANYIAQHEAIVELQTTISRRLKSDESCGHPFDEDLADGLKALEQLLAELEGVK